MKEKNRPLSPHLLIYKPQITSIISIFHRITGTVLALSYLSISTIFFYIFSFVSVNYYFHYCYYIVSLLFVFIGLFLLLTFFFHMSNGIRHITWDFGLNLDINSLTTSGLLVISLVFVFMLLAIFF